MSNEQDAFDEVFDSMIAVERSLDEVIDSLRAAGVQVHPEQRVVVSRWLDVFDVDTDVPMGDRLLLLREWLRSPWLVL